MTKITSKDRETFGVFLEGLKQMGLSVEDVDRIVYGTTVGANAIIERKGARTGLLCTRGFRDILDHQRWHQRVQYDLHQTRPEALVSRRWRAQITERVSGEGEVLLEPDEEEVKKAVEFLLSEEVESIAVAFLNSYANGHNESLVGEMLRKLDLPYVSVSSEISPTIYEWERTSTAVLNAYVQPSIERHVRQLQEELARTAPDVKLIVMQSNGGGVSAEHAVRVAVRTAGSGPAGGVAGARIIAGAAGFDNVISMDMGGTSCDVSVITDGKAEVTKESSLGYNLPVQLPMISVHTIGAGGGSLAYVDEGGALKVGPESAGAMPGPACYDRGGTQATLTDAHMLLDHFPPEGLAGGNLPLNRSKAEMAVGALADHLGETPMNVAAGILRIANSRMVEAVKLMTVDRGLDPRDYCLMAFGGMGAMHACDMASELGMNVVLVPRYPGVLSALGLATTDLQTDKMESINRSLGELSSDAIGELYHQLDRQCAQWIDEQGLDPDDVEFLWTADVRYAGQTYEITVPVQPADLRDGFSPLVDRFHEYHENVFGYSIREEVPFLVNVQVTGIGRLSDGSHRVPKIAAANGAPQPKDRRQTRIGNGELVEVDVFERTDLRAGHQIMGPALIEQADCAVILPPSWKGTVDAFGNVVARRE